MDQAELRAVVPASAHVPALAHRVPVALAHHVLAVLAALHPQVKLRARSAPRTIEVGVADSNIRRLRKAR